MADESGNTTAAGYRRETGGKACLDEIINDLFLIRTLDDLAREDLYKRQKAIREKSE